MKIFVYDGGYHGYFVRASDFAQALSIMKNRYGDEWEFKDETQESMAEVLYELSPDGEPGIIGDWSD